MRASEGAKSDWTENFEMAIDRLHILHAFSTFGTGGPQVRFALLANASGDQFQHTVLAMDGNYDCQERLDPSLNANIGGVSLSHAGTFSNIRAFRGILRQQRPNLLITYNWGSIEWAMAASMLPGQRHIHIEDGFGPGEETGPKWRRSAFRRLALRRTETVIVPSLVLRDIAAKAWRIPPDQLAYIPNGIDCKIYERPPERDLLPPAFLDPETPVIGTVATLRKEKNIPLLLSSFRSVLSKQPNAKLAIVGDGDERPALERLAAQFELGDRVCFTGNITGPERVVGLFDVFALSSDTEQMPLSVLEAMAAALPVAATNVGDVATMVAPSNQPFIVRKGDGEALARALAELVFDPVRCTHIGRHNQDKANTEYALSDMVQRHLDLWRRKPD